MEAVVQGQRALAAYLATKFETQSIQTLPGVRPIRQAGFSTGHDQWLLLPPISTVNHSADSHDDRCRDVRGVRQLEIYPPEYS